jgi:hypothetical protein
MLLTFMNAFPAHLMGIPGTLSENAAARASAKNSRASYVLHACARQTPVERGVLFAEVFCRRTPRNEPQPPK